MPPPLPESKRSAIVADIRAGGSCRAIAKAHNVSPSTVAKLAEKHGLADAFNRSQTEKATQAKRADNASRRAVLSVRLLDAAESALNRMEQPAIVYNFGGSENSYNERELPSPPSGDLRNLMVTAAAAIDKHVVIEKLDSDHDAKTAGALLDTLLDDLRGRHGSGDDTKAG